MKPRYKGTQEYRKIQTKNKETSKQRNQGTKKHGNRNVETKKY